MIVQLKDLPVVLLLLSGVAFSIYAKKLTVPAAFTGLICGLLIYLGAGYAGILMLTTFFLGGTIATSWGRRKKQELDQPGDSVKRNSGQVLANSGTATLVAIVMLIFPTYRDMLMPVLSAGLASAMADTLSSELGMLYGRSFYNCLTWKKDERGLDGVVSPEGTFIGIAGALVISTIYAAAEGFHTAFLIIIFAGAAGNFADSFLGAALERKYMLNNDWVNFLSTLFAAGLALLILVFFR
ncbi:DUF92 domain-containing protein [Pedobacter hartonius]|uniref:TIGR00297 family protein n=1 Tax=Pedobacter hartonius TaxID=425514 RepID=A0A1H4AL83_9SPHI|nr:DUF92 domain-containing protein [Pedobacter hartonius]SEA36729.1 TIGR00297 family protein [Pedobacter hartonius]